MFKIGISLFIYLLYPTTFVSTTIIRIKSIKSIKRNVLWILDINLRIPFFNNQLFPFNINHMQPIKNVVVKFIPSVISICNQAKSNFLSVSQTKINYIINIESIKHTNV